MIKVSLNITTNASTLNLIPIYFEFESPREFTKFIRENVIEILSWNFETYGQSNNTRIATYIREDDTNEEWWEWKFIINCKNIREFKPYMAMDFNEFSSVLESHNRDKKLKEIGI